MKEETKDLKYWKLNAEEDYIKTPISVLRYISELEKSKEMEKEQKHELKEKYFIKGYIGAELDNFIYDDSTELSAKELFNELNKSE